jgi:drug/metabolite transporter (DMT)-like permease
MSRPESPRSREQESFWHRRRPGIRYIYSAAAIVGGIVLAVRFADGAGDSPFFIAALLVIALGIISIPVYLWMDKRRL